MTTASFTVTGMTCGHCAAAVREEVSEIPGHTVVSVDHASGHLEVNATGEIDDAAVLAAVAEAGYQAQRA